MNAHYEKVIVACAFLTLFVNIGFPSTSFNVYMPYVVGEVGDVGGSLVLALRTLASMGAVIVVDRYFHLFDLRVGLALGFAFTATGFAVYGFASTLPVFLAGGVITGLGYGLGGMVGVTMLIRRWYASGFRGAIGLQLHAAAIERRSADHCDRFRHTYFRWQPAFRLMGRD